MDLLPLIILFTLTFAATFFSSISGGTGLFTIPLLILFGLSPQVALSTNKVGTLGLMVGGIGRFMKETKKYLDWPFSLKLALISSISSFLGAHLLEYFSQNFLELLTGIAVLFMIPLSYYFRSIGLQRTEPPSSLRYLGYSLFFITCFIAGFFGAGIGIINMFILMTCFGLDIIEARANTLLPHLFIAISSLPVLSSKGFVNWKVGLVVLVAMYIGANLGTRFGIKKGVVWVKLVFNLIIALMALRLIFSGVF